MKKEKFVKIIEMIQGLKKELFFDRKLSSLLHCKTRGKKKRLSMNNKISNAYLNTINK